MVAEQVLLAPIGALENLIESSIEKGPAGPFLADLVDFD